MWHSSFEDSRASESALLLNSVRNNEQHFVNSTLERGADVDFLDPHQPVDINTPLRAACAQANVVLIRTLLYRGANVFAHFSSDRWTALHSAAHHGHDHILRLVLVEAQELHENLVLDGFHFLHLLCEVVNSRLSSAGSDLLNWVLRYRPEAEVDSRSQREGYINWTPLHLACARGCTGVAACLLHAGANIDTRSGEFDVRSPLANELTSGQGAQVASSEFITYDEREAVFLDKGLLPVHLAAFGGHLRTVQLLLRYGQCVNDVTERHRWTALMFSIWSGNNDLVREVCRVGGRNVVNDTDIRADGSQWTPLSLAVARHGPDIVHTLMSYGADPLVRLNFADFPGSAFLQLCAPRLIDSPANTWSGPDGRVSLLHLAIVRGSLEMLRTVLPIVRAAHFAPVKAASRRPPLVGATPWEDVGCSRRSQGRPRHCSARRVSSSRRGCRRDLDTSIGAQRASEHSRLAQDSARERLLLSPACERQDCDPVAFCTTHGWSPAVLAVLLHTVDPDRRVSFELLESSTDPTVFDNPRSDIFLELLSTDRSLLEDQANASPPVIPQRLQDVSQTLINRTVDEFLRLCKAAQRERVAYRLLHATLCVACRFDRREVVHHLLSSGFCDPRCRFLRPIESRPLHVATSHGFGELAQLLLDYHADPLEQDGSKQEPVRKLASYYTTQVHALHDRIGELEAELRSTQGHGDCGRWASKLGDASEVTGASLSTRGRSLDSPRRSGTGTGRRPSAGPRPRADSAMHDSRM
eukprot:TRINITY_DN34301_c0_g1_i1.p1 TRINITY_DN34301_c0_g1~~TRINITY_DN34301_c0_g1_i1.p1  ORF type:complete len:755 (+),score=81.79 TRINITY_DN34301_c0_g1_i1:72-2336(+)